MRALRVASAPYVPLSVQPWPLVIFDVLSLGFKSGLHRRADCKGTWEMCREERRAEEHWVLS
jgi:hypothetical protein